MILEWSLWNETAWILILTLYVCVAWFYHLKNGNDIFICFREFLWRPKIINVKYLVLNKCWPLILLCVVSLWQGHRGPEGRVTDQIWRKSRGRKQLEHEPWSFWRILEDSKGQWIPGKSLGRRWEEPRTLWGPPACLIHKASLLSVTFKFVGWPWTMTLIFTPPSFSISTFVWAKQT